MEFRLIYQGPLYSRKSRHLVENKNQIRAAFHEQLAFLWQIHPRLRRFNRVWRDIYTGRARERKLAEKTKRPIPEIGETEIDAIGRRYEKGGIRFVPLVNDEFQLVCALTIVFLRREKAGNIMVSSSGGDIDNRIKTLVDALRVPRTEDEMKGCPVGISPFFCLMADDSLVTELNVITDRLLTPANPDNTHPEADAHVTILAKIKASVENVEGLKELM